MKELVAAEEARIARDLADPKINRPGLKEQYEIQLNDLKSDSSPDAELLPMIFAFPSVTGACKNISHCVFSIRSTFSYRRATPREACTDLGLRYKPSILPWFYREYAA